MLLHSITTVVKINTKVINNYAQEPVVYVDLFLIPPKNKVGVPLFEVTKTN